MNSRSALPCVVQGSRWHTLSSVTSVPWPVCGMGPCKSASAPGSHFPPHPAGRGVSGHRGRWDFLSEVPVPANTPRPPRGAACADPQLGKERQGPLGLFCSCSWNRIKPIAEFPLSKLISLWPGGKWINTAFYADIMLPEGNCPWFTVPAFSPVTEAVCCLGSEAAQMCSWGLPSAQSPLRVPSGEEQAAPSGQSLALAWGPLAHVFAPHSRHLGFIFSFL